MPQNNFKTPGVYVNEMPSSTSSVIPAATAVPAFIGYTPQASYDGKSLLNTAVRICSIGEFMAYYGTPDMTDAGKPFKPYDPQYYLQHQDVKPERGNYLLLDSGCYAIVPDPCTIYYLYNSVRLFFMNGGQDAYIVSVGVYGAPSGLPTKPGENIVNPNVQVSELLSGLAILKEEQVPTMYICPEATLLSVPDNAILMQAMLLQTQELRTAMNIFDVIGGKAPDPVLFMQDVNTFRAQTGTAGLDFGAAYYPFVGTTVMDPAEIDYTNLFAGDIKQLEPILNPASAPNPTVKAIIDGIQSGTSRLTTAEKQNALINASPTYQRILTEILADVNMLPASGAAAGVIARTDADAGPWQAPANTAIAGVVSLPINLSDSQQALLNIDAVSGKSVNAIRSFPSRGILIWGARTLAGNSPDWRYIPVRRTVTYIEQSCRQGIQAFVFFPNDARTWVSGTASISGFLTDLWRQGGLVGAKASDAFSVSCGLGSTMTAQDVANGLLKVTILVAVTHPAEFIVIQLQQQMEASSQIDGRNCM